MKYVNCSTQSNLLQYFLKDRNYLPRKKMLFGLKSKVCRKKILSARKTPNVTSCFCKILLMYSAKMVKSYRS